VHQLDFKCTREFDGLNTKKSYTNHYDRVFGDVENFSMKKIFIVSFINEEVENTNRANVRVLSVVVFGEYLRFHWGK